MYELTTLPKLRKRTIRHADHMRDNSCSEKFMQLTGRINTFPCSPMDEVETLLIFPQFEAELAEPLDELVDHFSEDYSHIHLISFPIDTPNRYPDLEVGDCETQFRIYQTPLAPEVYQKSLRRFKSSGFRIRKLHSRDVSQVVELTKRWLEEKKARLRDSYFTKTVIDVTDLGQVNDLKVTLSGIGEELKALRLVKMDPESIQRAITAPLSRVYGTFWCSRLVAYIHTEGNSEFQSFQDRVSLRFPYRSPQEFLDLNLSLMYAQEGVKTFERGFDNECIGKRELLKYKGKFGPIKMVEEMDLKEVSVTYFRD